MKRTHFMKCYENASLLPNSKIGDENFRDRLKEKQIDHYISIYHNIDYRSDVAIEHLHSVH